MKVGDLVSWGSPWKESGTGVIVSIRKHTRFDGTMHFKWATCVVFFEGKTEHFLGNELELLRP